MRIIRYFLTFLILLFYFNSCCYKRGTPSKIGLLLNLYIPITEENKDFKFAANSYYSKDTLSLRELSSKYANYRTRQTYIIQEKVYMENKKGLVHKVQLYWIIRSGFANDTLSPSKIDFFTFINSSRRDKISITDIKYDFINKKYSEGSLFCKYTYDGIEVYNIRFKVNGKPTASSVYWHP